MPEISSQPQASPNKKLFSLKNISIAVVSGAVVIGLGVSAWYFYSRSQGGEEPLPDSEIGIAESKKNCEHITLKPDWQTYENDYKFGYSLKYPADWRVTGEIDEEGKYQGWFVNFSYNAEGDEENSVSIGMRNLHTLEAYQQVATNSKNSPHVFGKNETIPFDYDEALRFTGYKAGQEDYEYTYHWVSYDQIGLNRVFRGPSESSKANDHCEYAVYQTMLGTYRFGKKYENKEVGFEFRYPTSWEIKENYFYETAGGSKAKFPTILLGSKNSNDENEYIRSNLRQADCSTFHQFTPEEEYINGNKVKTYAVEATGTCVEAEVKAKNKDGKEGPYIFLTYAQDKNTQNIFKQLINTFKVTK